jgi:hypothetical protein
VRAWGGWISRSSSSTPASVSVYRVTHSTRNLLALADPTFAISDDERSKLSKLSNKSLLNDVVQQGAGKLKLSVQF